MEDDSNLVKSDVEVMDDESDAYGTPESKQDLENHNVEIPMVKADPLPAPPDLFIYLFIICIINLEAQGS